MPLLALDPTDPLPLYAQLERGIRLAIATGRWSAGDQLPTVRQLAVALRINANTVAKVYAELERAGVLESRRGVGTFVRAAHAGGLEDWREQREQKLRDLADRFLLEATGLGFSPADAIRHLDERAFRQEKNQ
jgi:GntR family transcriptional regulator